MGFLANEEINFEDEKNAYIINHVLKNYHRLLKDELPKIKDLILTLYRVHFEENSQVLERVHRLFSMLNIELETHIIREERSLFYMIKDYDHNPSKELLENIVNDIRKIDKGNQRVNELLIKIREITNEYALPLNTCPTYEKTYNKLKKIERETEEHLEFENILFDRFKNMI